MIYENNQQLRNYKKDLHSKSHFKGAMSLMMKDSKVMSYDDGSANEIIK